MEFSEKIISLLNSVKCAGAVCGAGISQESGVPTFRGKDGLWRKYRAEELATFEAFSSNPNVVWEWYNYRKGLISGVEPNPGHYALYEMEKVFDEFFIITQNVDGLHRRVGSENVIEIHGNIMRSRCIKCNSCCYDVPIEDEVIELPRCVCGGLLRPDVVWFGEVIPEDLLLRSYELLTRCEILFVVGTSGYVHPAASFPSLAKGHGAYLVEVNVDETMISDIMDETLIGKSGEILPELVKKAAQPLF